MLRSRTSWTRARLLRVRQWAGAAAMGARAMDGSRQGPHARTAVGTGGSVVSKAQTGASRAPGTDAGHDKGAQCRGPGLGCWWGTAREARRGGRGG